MRQKGGDEVKYLWKSMREGLKSEHGNINWKIGEWFEIEGKPELCGRGFHASEKVIQAMGYVNMEILAKVQVKGKVLKSDDKWCAQKMKIVKAWKWKKEDSVALSIFAAELCIDAFEKEYPNDKRPRNAIEAAKAYLKNPCKETQDAARSAASAASAAWSAEYAARSAEYAARSAASAAWSAARSAASAAWSAAWSAEYAARSAASAAHRKITNKCEAFIQERIKKLEEIK
jgi:hypothetical protein